MSRLIPVDNAFDAYRRIATEPVLTHEEFSVFWVEMSIERQDFWMATFRSRLPLLSRTLLKLPTYSNGEKPKSRHEIALIIRAAIDELMTTPYVGTLSGIRLMQCHEDTNGEWVPLPGAENSEPMILPPLFVQILCQKFGHLVSPEIVKQKACEYLLALLVAIDDDTHAEVQLRFAAVDVQRGYTKIVATSR